jgi:hypothetical protein
VFVGSPTTANAATRYHGVVGAGGTDTTESDVEMVLRGSGTIRNLYGVSIANTATADTVFTMRKNGADQSLTLTLPATTTGTFSDTTNSFTFVDGDIITMKSVRGAATGSGTFISMAYEILYDPESTGGGFQAAWASGSNSIITGANI